MSASNLARLNLALRQRRNVYSGALGKALAERCEEIAAQQGESWLTLRDEVELTRAMVIDAVVARETSVAAVKNIVGVTQEKIDLVTLSANNVVHAAIDRVVHVALAAKRMQSVDDVTLMQTHAVVLQATHVFDDELQQRASKMRAAGLDPTELLDAVARRLRDEVRVPDVEANMVTLEDANDEYEAMIATIPKQGDVA